MKLFYTDIFELPLPAEHRFPMLKYRRLRERAEAELEGAQLLVPPAATDDALRLVHDGEYVKRVCEGTLSALEVRRIGFPWSEGLVERSRRSVGATIAAARAALEDRGAANLAGGTHHAFADSGQGYCVFNDAAVAIRVMQSEAQIRRAVVVDADVHQGNGTAAIFEDDPSVFTYSIHGDRNYPFRKQASDLDIALPDGTGDEEYLSAFSTGLAKALASRPDLLIFLAGADPFEGDRLGRLALSKAALSERDRRLFEACRERRLPVTAVMAGGYASDVEDIVDIHLETLRQLQRALQGAPGHA
ncbi:MAG: histone deacetylase [Planctomycetota bacterium]